MTRCLLKFLFLKVQPVLLQPGPRVTLVLVHGLYTIIVSRLFLLHVILALYPGYSPTQQHKYLTHTLCAVSCPPFFSFFHSPPPTLCPLTTPGPFSDFVRHMDDPSKPKIVQPSAGIHIILPGYYSPRSMGMLDPATSDGRVIFFLPWEGKPHEINFDPIRPPLI